MELQNANPTIYHSLKERMITSEEITDDVYDEIDSREIFDLIRMINDPEHPLTLEQLNVIEEKNISIDDSKSCLKIYFTPTIPHCSMATLIGLSIRVLLIRSLPARFKVDVLISPGSHVSELAVNKQLADKERIAAALENVHLLKVINQCLTVKD